MRRVARHLAPKRRERVTVPVPAKSPVAANLALMWPVSRYRTPAWDIFEPEGETWGHDWLTADERRVA